MDNTEWNPGYSPCSNCSETYRKRPRCKKLGCPVYVEIERKADDLLEKYSNEYSIKRRSE